MDASILHEVAGRGGFWSYIAGVAYQMLRRYPVAGLELVNTYTDLPVQKGLSSSAAISVLTARAFNHVYGLGLSVREEMELAYQGEITTPSRCGRMDQGCAFGRRAVWMTFDGDRLETRELRVPQSLHLVVVDLGASKDTQRILADLNACYPKPETAVAQGVHNLLGPLNEGIVKQAVEALESGNGSRLGALMLEAQALFDRYAAPACPAELTAPVLHRVLDHPSLRPHVWGGKGVGSQGDGSAQFVARSAADQEAVVELAAAELGMAALKLTIRP
jgi:galactokinase